MNRYFASSDDKACHSCLGLNICTGLKSSCQDPERRRDFAGHLLPCFSGQFTPHPLVASFSSCEFGTCESR